jgi:hypothetical protein
MAPHCEDSVVSIHQLKVTLATITPLIWRRLHVRSDATLAELHQVLQSAMGWENYHLHAFEVGWNRYGGGEGRDETAATLAGVLPKEGDGMIYTYDFGDEWQHVIDAREDPSAPPRHSVPRCSAGRRARPPQDCGGPYGYADMLKALRARKGWPLPRSQRAARRPLRPRSLRPQHHQRGVHATALR